MRNKLVGIILVFVVVGYSHAQEFTTVDPSHCDCENAIYTEDASFEPMSMPKGFGEKLEIKGNSIKNKYVPTKEHNSLWIRFKFKTSTNFEFKLSPSVPTDDFDFSLWKINGDHYCDSIINGVLPIRSNLAKRRPEQGSVTGLKKGAGQDFAKAGPNPTFSNAVTVHKGDEFMLLIDAPYGARGGFTTSFQYERYVEPVLEEPEPVVDETPIIPQLFIKVKGENNEQISDVKIRIKGLPDEDSLYLDDGYFIVSRMRQYTNYIIDVDKRDYLHSTDKYFSKVLKNDTVIIRLEKLKIGSKLQFQNILFIPDQSTIISSSYRDLKRIRNFLSTNPHISVEIMGHVNGLGNKKRKYKELSERRAKAIYEYLVEEGISKDQLSFEGYGAEQLIYLNPKDENESRLNRRVEVVITKI